MDKYIKKERSWEDKPTVCSLCMGILHYHSHGEYICETCGHIERDNFGKVCHYIEENGPSPAIVISEETGVTIDKINSYLKQGRIEIPEGSSVYIPCESCGRDIRFGRFCPECALRLSKQVQGAFEVGEIPKHKSQGNEGTMHFIGKEEIKNRRKNK